MDLHQFMADFAKLSCESEDGDLLRICSQEGATEATLCGLRERIDCSVPEELGELLQFSDGLLFFGEQILAAGEMFLLPSHRGLLPFHSWGNGDFDCLGLASKSSSFSPGQVFFVSHKHRSAVAVETSLTGWLKRVHQEVSERGALLHPMDYSCQSRPSFLSRLLGHKEATTEYSGMYCHVGELLKSDLTAEGEVRIETEYYGAERKMLEMHYIGNKLHGPRTEWYEDGNLKSTSFFENGRQYGSITRYSPTGEITAQGQVRKGIPWEGTFIHRDENGQATVVEYRKGKRT